jgi:hypothetical protein
VPISVSLEPTPQREESTLKYLVNNFNRIRDAFKRAWDSSLNWSESAKAFGGTAVWSPLVQQGSLVAYAGTSLAEYTIIGETVLGHFSLNITGSGTAGSIVQISTPTAVSTTGRYMPVGGGWVFYGTNIPMHLISQAGSNNFSYVVPAGEYPPSPGLVVGVSLQGFFMYRKG